MSYRVFEDRQNTWRSQVFGFHKL